VKKREYGSGSLVKKKGSSNWFALWRVNGRQFSKSTGTAVKARALAKLNAILGRAAAGLPQPGAFSGLRYETLRDAYLLTLQLKKRKSLYTNSNGVTGLSSLTHLDKFFNNWKVVNITSDTIRKFVLERQAAGATNGTINRALSAMKALLRLGQKEGKVPAVPYIEMLREANPRKGFVTVEQFDRLYKILPERLRTVLALGFYRGLRVGEIRKLQWPDIDFDAAVIRLATGETKSDQGRIIPLNTELLAALRRLHQSSNSPFVFGTNGKPLSSFRRAWYSACVKAGLGRFEKLSNGRKVYRGTLFHDLRRSAVMGMMQAGLDPAEAKAITGHRTDSVFQRYNIITEARLRKASQKQDGYIRAQRRKTAAVTVEVIHTLPEAEQGKIDAGLMRIQGKDATKLQKLLASN